MAIGVLLVVVLIVFWFLYPKDNPSFKSGGVFKDAVRKKYDDEQREKNKRR